MSEHLQVVSDEQIQIGIDVTMLSKLVELGEIPESQLARVVELAESMTDRLLASNVFDAEDILQYLERKYKK